MSSSKKNWTVKGLCGRCLCRNIVNFRVKLFPRSVLKIFFTYLPGSGKRQDWVYLSSEQGVFNELDLNIRIIASFEPNLNFTWLFYWKIWQFWPKGYGLLAETMQRAKILLIPGWVWIFGWSYWGIHILKKSIFDLLTFLQGRPKIFKIFIGRVDFFLRTLFLCAGSPGILLFWAILCLSSHSCTIVSLQITIVKNLVVLYI